MTAIHSAMIGMFVSALMRSAFAADAGVCGDLKNHFGPFDYRTVTQEQRDMVESYHFTPKVATLKGGQSTMEIGADIAYTLRVFPNHPRALNSMAELARREKRPAPVGATLSVECWFERAIRFRPDDGQVRMVYGFSLLKDGKREAAVEQLKKSVELMGESGNAHYNLGLAYFELGDYEAAQSHAKKAQSLGFTLPGLQSKLEKIGKWK